MKILPQRIKIELRNIIWGFNVKKWALILILLLICYTSLIAQKTSVVKASGTIYIRSDGSIIGTDKIQRNGAVYTFTSNINDEIVVEKDNVVIDGTGYMLQGVGSGIGIDLTQRRNVTVKNLNIRLFDSGIYISDNINLASSAGSHGCNKIYSCCLSDNNIGIQFYCNVNLLGLSGYDIATFGDNYICSNSISQNNVGILFGYNINSLTLSDSASATFGSNKIYGNSIIGNSFAIKTDSNINILTIDASSLLVFGHNLIFNNNLMNNTEVSVEALNINVLNGFGTVLSGVNLWDSGYPSGGNYWSDYNGTDSGGDGIGDTQYIIDASNIDNYPLMGMFSSFTTSYGYAVDFVSNSSISDVSFTLSNIEVYPPEAILAFNVSGDIDTDGFLRVCIPKILINGSYVIMFDDEIITNTTWPQVRELPCSNETYEYLYINYTHCEHTIIITGTTAIPEFPSFLILPLFMISTLLAVIVYKRKGTR